MNVLLIDDDDVYNFLHLSLLKVAGLGSRIDVCKSAREAIRYLEVSNEPPDLIFLDIMMPEMDGHGFLAAFKQMSERITRRTQIAMLTSSLDPEDRKRAMLNEHVVYFIEKPLTKEKIADLTKVLNQLKAVV